MPERKTIAAYLEAVQGQIRWKRARPLLVRELERHLEDQRDDFLKEGKAPDEAERLAVEDMGDPVTVGTELDRVHRPRPQWGLLGLTIALAAIGVVLLVLFRQSYVQQMGIMRFLASLGLGTVAMLGMYFFDVSRLVRHARAVYIGTLAMTVLLRAVLYPTYYNALMSALYPLIYALWLYSFRGKGWKGFVLVILGGVPLAVSCEVIPSMSSLSVLLLSGLVVTLYAVGRDWFGVGRWKGLASALAIPALLLTWLLSQGYLSSLRGRLQIALHPEQDKLGRGFRGFILQAFWQDVPPLRQHGSVGAAVHAGVRVRVLTSGGQEMRPIDFSHGFLPASMAAAWGWVPLLVLLAALGGAVPLAAGEGPAAELSAGPSGGAGGNLDAGASNPVQCGAELRLCAVLRQPALGGGELPDSGGHGPYRPGPVGVPGRFRRPGGARRPPPPAKTAAAPH